jgi:hypothetical protein
MANEQVPSPTPAPSPLARLGFSGMLLVVGGLGGTLVVFLPLVSVWVGGMEGRGSVHKTVMIVQDWRGKLGLAGYLAALVCAFVLYPPNGLGQKALCWAGIGAGLLVAVLAILLLVVALEPGDLMGMGSVSTTVDLGPGPVLNIVAGLMVAAGGFLKAREENLI